MNGKYLWPLMLWVLTQGCTYSAQTFHQEPEGSEQVKYTCETPDDAKASADLVWVVEDTTLVMGDGKSFSAWTYEGKVPGPVIRMNLGETKKIKLENRSPRPVSLHFHGASYFIADDGIMEFPQGVVNPGCSHVYTITASTPGVWPFHSHVDTAAALTHGLYGAVIVPAPDESPVDREFVLFMGQLGSEGEEEEHEIKLEEMEEEEEGFWMTFNGYPDGKGPVIEWDGKNYTVTPGAIPRTQVGERVRWRILNVSPNDWHTFGIHHHVFCDRGGVADGGGICPNQGQLINIVDLSPLKGTSLEYVEGNSGMWMYHCHILDHVGEGMSAFYEVMP